MDGDKRYLKVYNTNINILQNKNNVLLSNEN